MKTRSKSRRAVIKVKQERDSLIPHTFSLDVKQEDETSIKDVLHQNDDHNQFERDEIDGETKSADVEVKKENTEKNSTILQDEADKEYFYICNLCGNKPMPSLKTLLKHRISAHNITQRKRLLKHIDLEPDIHHPNHYCKPCETKFKSKNLYKSHLRNTHHIKLKPKRLGKPRNLICFRCSLCNITCQSKSSYHKHLESYHQMEPVPLQKSEILPDRNDPSNFCPSCNFTYETRRAYLRHCSEAHNLKRYKTPCKVGIPDIADPNNYCKVCERTYINGTSYREHCRIIHKVRPVNFANPDAVPNITDPRNYCKICNRSFVFESAYWNHLFNIHNINTSLDTAKPCDKQPDINDPNNYCCCCDKTFSSKRYHRTHLLEMHSIRQPMHRKDKVEPDVDDPDHHCHVCRKNYTSIQGYRRHLRSTHQMKLPPLRSPRNATLLPDPRDPNLHCSVCDVTIKTRGGYRQHCRSIHYMELDHSSIVNSNAKIDVNHPDFYCSQCEHYYIKRTFKLHLKKVHRIF